MTIRREVDSCKSKVINVDDHFRFLTKMMLFLNSSPSKIQNWGGVNHRIIANFALI